MKIRILPFVDHEIGRQLLQNLIARGKQKLDIVAVVSTSENGKMWWPGVEDICVSEGIPLLRYPSCGIEAIEHISPDWSLFLSWKYLMPDQILRSAQQGAINLHYSLLPKYRGVYPVNWALIDGCQETGITFHLVNLGIDSGDIVIQRKARILPSDTARTLQKRLDVQASEAFDELLELIEKGEVHVTATPQNDIERPNYKSRQDFEAVCELDLDHTCTLREAIDLLRGLSFLPTSSNAFFEDKRTGEKTYLQLVLSPETDGEQKS
jgi:methionyl-tRNA formyltransferase